MEGLCVAKHLAGCAGNSITCKSIDSFVLCKSAPVGACAEQNSVIVRGRVDASLPLPSSSWSPREPRWVGSWILRGTSPAPYVCPSIHLGVLLSVCPSLHPFVHLPIRVSVCPSICPSIHPHVHLYICPSNCPSIGLSVHPSIHLSMHMFICTSICPSDAHSFRLQAGMFAYYPDCSTGNHKKEDKIFFLVCLVSYLFL